MQEKKSKVEQAFFALLRAGLWEQPVSLASFAPLDYDALFRLAKEQSVIGLIAAGFEHVSDMEPGEDDVVPFMHKVLHQESRNEAMDAFIVKIVTQLKDAGIRAVLVKGQGIAQCYVRPRWRACGDIDLFLDETDYAKAKDLLSPMASLIDSEGAYSKHLGMTIDSWTVELHGSFRCGLSSRIDKVMDGIRDDVFGKGKVRPWQNETTPVLLPGKDEDAVYVFVHILNHFYKGGIGLRQICDWCRLLWTYRATLDPALLEEQLRRAGLISEWKAFGSFAVEWLGMDKESMPFYSPSQKWVRKAGRIKVFIMMSGNFGHNRDNSYFQKYPYLIRKCVSFGRRLGDLARHARIFPLDSFRFMPRIIINGVRAAANGE